ncbi:hypothetical protein C1H46_036662 [Malus baccata]|uniref:Uncharacterized protein n=1 Tax=Malus baccata TaxID=106549 RepID=A0A540KV17_MALBA|nr:hypothetical protein C1H46_036662 [Malus baccata]
MMDLSTATHLDPTLSYPYKYRAVSLLEENQFEAAITEINKIISFKVSPDCLELRAWFSIALEDFEGALRDVRALLTLDPNYMMFHGKMHGDHLVELLCPFVQQWSQADCWMQLYDRWSSVDDIGSLAVVHHMLANDPGKSLLRFRQSLLLLRLNCQKAAMHSLRLARNHSSSEHERLVYEGWILYDTGHREEALAKAEESIAIQRSFEAFFLKAYALADSSLDSDSSTYVIQLLEEALRCPSDGLRKGQALNNLGSVYVDSDKLDLAADCYTNALNIKHTRAHQGLARVYHLKNQRKAAYDEMTKLIEKARNNASAFEKRSEYCDRDMAKSDLSMATQLDPLRTYPYRYRAAVLMDDHKEGEAIEELTKAITFKLDLQLLHLRAAFHESMSNFVSTVRDCEAALCLDPNHADTHELYSKARERVNEQKKFPWPWKRVCQAEARREFGFTEESREEQDSVFQLTQKCPRMLNINAPLLSTRHLGNSGGEDLQGVLLPMSEDIQSGDTPRPKLPPGWWHRPLDKDNECDHELDGGCEGDIDLDDVEDDIDDVDYSNEAFSDAIVAFSLSVAIDIVEKKEQRELMKQQIIA